MRIKSEEKLNAFVDYLLESFFDGSPRHLTENLPPGFTSNDIKSPTDYINNPGLFESNTEPFFDKNVNGEEPADMDTMLKKKKEFGGKSDHETPYIHTSAFVVVDENDEKIDLEKLKQIITQRPETILQQNGKLQKSGGKQSIFFNLTLPAYKGLWYDETKNEFRIITTCPNAGNCKLICYARKGGYVQFPASFISSARVINFLLNDWQGFKRQLTKEIKQMYNKYNTKGIGVVIRWHDSGDFFNEKYLQIALDIARETPEVIHYAYTKSVDMVSKSEKPKNFVFNYSMGGKQDDSIKPENKKSVIVPKQYFKDLFVQKGAHLDIRSPITPKMLEILRERLSKAYNIPSENIITYEQLLKIPYDPSNSNIIPKYHVIVKSGDGDDAAMRNDVITTMLFIH